MSVPLQVVREIPLTITQKLGKCIGSMEFVFDQAAIAQLGERETEDLKVPSSILGLGTAACFKGPSTCRLRPALLQLLEESSGGLKCSWCTLSWKSQACV